MIDDKSLLDLAFTFLMEMVDTKLGYIYPGDIPDECKYAGQILAMMCQHKKQLDLKNVPHDLNDKIELLRKKLTVELKAMELKKICDKMWYYCKHPHYEGFKSTQDELRRCLQYDDYDDK